MSDHKAWLASVPEDQRAELTARSDAPGLLRLAVHFGLILLIGGLIAAGVPFWWLLLPVQGVLIAFLFMLSHECTHKTPFATGWINEVAGHAVAALIALPFRAFRYFHLAHHRWTNIPGKDPELATPRPTTAPGWVWQLSGGSYVWGQGRQVLLLATGRFEADWLPEGAKRGAVGEARWILGIYALAALSFVWTPVLFWVWLLPLALGLPFLRVYLLAEHGDCPQVADMFLNTRTTFTAGVVRFLAWNMPYHTEHHVWPAVPFHRLPALHRKMRGELRMTADGYVAFARAHLARQLTKEPVLQPKE